MIETFDPSRQVLDETLGKALTFLRAAGTSRPIRAALATRGYKKKAHERGWSLVLAAAGFAEDTAAADPDVDLAVAEAAVQVDAWDEPNFDIISTALAFHFPDQHKFLFNNLKPARGAESVITVGTMLDRLDELDNGKDRKATRKKDHEALAVLADRGITAEERARMRGLVKTVKDGTADVEAPVAPDLEDDKAREAREQALRELYFWYKEWTAVARAVIKRGDYLIRLGLRNRKSAADDGGEETGDGKAPADPNQPAAAPARVTAGRAVKRGRKKK